MLIGTLRCVDRGSRENVVEKVNPRFSIFIVIVRTGSLFQMWANSPGDEFQTAFTQDSESEK